MLKRLSKYIKIVFLFLSIVSCENTENKIHKSTDGSVKNIPVGLQKMLILKIKKSIKQNL